MSEAKPTQLTPGRSGTGEPPAPHGWRPDAITLSILGFFVVLSLVMVAFMWNGYVLLSNGAAVDRLLARGEYREAIPHLVRIVERSPASYDRQRQLGDCYLFIEPPQPKLAMAHYALALKYNPDMNLNRELGMAYSELGDQTEALKFFTPVLQEDPADPGVNFFMGRNFFRHGMYREAASSFQAAAADKKWDDRAAPFRRELAEKVFGSAPAGQAETPAENRSGPSPTGPATPGPPTDAASSAPTRAGS
ncbi:MAG: tetratricopeptide repeat protein [bacterium]|nr:tetratricopeptide repeat protein [bacterium]